MKLNQPYYVEPREGESHLDLGGVWEYGYRGSIWDGVEELELPYYAHIPDSLFWNLYESGVLPHPYKGCNSREYSWVDEKVWYFRRTFHAAASLKNRTVLLCFDGVAYYMRVWLNRVELGEHEGMAGGPAVDVSKLIRFGGEQENELVVEVCACTYKKKSSWDCRNLNGLNREIVPWNIARDSDTSNGDWIVMGIWRTVRVEFLSSLHLARPYLTTTSLSGKNAVLRLEVEILCPEVKELHPLYGVEEENPDYTFAYGDGLCQEKKDAPASIRITMKEKGCDGAAFHHTYPLELLDYEASQRTGRYPESQFFEQDFSLRDVKLWWPHDIGEPHLYTVKLDLIANGAICDSLSFDYGVRTVETIRSNGPRARERWDSYWFVINGRTVFLKGVNWMPQDALYRLDEEELDWSLKLVRDAGIHMVRVWSGGGVPESDRFYRLCDEMGLMVWQDHFIANTSHTEGWPKDVLECQECMNLYRLRNHSSLAVHCGGNEFNAYHYGNAASLAVMYRSVRTLDPNRIWYDTTPDKGSAHIYRDMEPIWYRLLYRDLPFVAETGIHSFPTYQSLCSCLGKKECRKNIPEITSEAFQKQFPELLNHFVEYVPERVPRMLARASQIIPLDEITLEKLCEATQIASCEYYEILIQALRGNYPVTVGVMPWVFRRTWTTVGIQLVDGGGMPIAPYYYLKNAFRKLEVHLAIEQISLFAGERLRIPIRLCNEYEENLENKVVEVKGWSPEMECLVSRRLAARKADQEIFEMDTRTEWLDRFFFLTVELRERGRLLARQVYWPKCLSVLEDHTMLKKYRSQPQENFRLDRGPWLKLQVEGLGGALLKSEAVSASFCGRRGSCLVRIKNIGEKAAFPVWIRCGDAFVRSVAEDNFFWIEKDEERLLWLDMDAPGGLPGQITVQISAWNAPKESFLLTVEDSD